MRTMSLKLSAKFCKIFSYSIELSHSMYRNLLISNCQQFYLVVSGEIDVGTIEVQLIHATDKNEKKN